MFEGWAEYYLLIGGGAAALIGLLFVVATLTANFPRDRAQRGIALFMTPTLFDLAVVLALSGAALAHGVTAGVTAGVIGAAAVGGGAFAIVTGVQIARPGVREHWSDPLAYAALPLLLYVGLGATAAGFAMRAEAAAPALAAVLMLLMLLAIRNAWDLVTWMALRSEKPGG